MTGGGLWPAASEPGLPAASTKISPDVDPVASKSPEEQLLMPPKSVVDECAPNREDAVADGSDLEKTLSAADPSCFSRR